MNNYLKVFLISINFGPRLPLVFVSPYVSFTGSVKFQPILTRRHKWWLDFSSIQTDFYFGLRLSVTSFIIFYFDRTFTDLISTCPFDLYFKRREGKKYTRRVFATVFYFGSYLPTPLLGVGVPTSNLKIIDSPYFWKIVLKSKFTKTWVSRWLYNLHLSSDISSLESPVRSFVKMSL